jgi:hypothetical protein
MSAVMVPIRSIKQYLKDFGYEAIIEKKQDKGLVKKQILDAFQKEIFGQIFFRFNDPNLLSKSASDVDEKTREGVRHILSNARWKWKRLCAEFNKYPETRNIIDPDELMLNLKDAVKLQGQDISYSKEGE